MRPSSDAISLDSRAARTARRLILQLVGAGALLAALGVSGVLAQSGSLVMIDALQPGELRSGAFSLDRATTLGIDAVGAEHANSEGFFDRMFGRDRDVRRDGELPWQGNAWILDARTRRVVWELRRARTEHDRGDVYTFDGRVRLPAGDYEAYYASYPDDWTSRRYASRERKFMDRFRPADVNEKFRLKIDGEGRRLRQEELARIREDAAGRPVVAFTGVGPSTSDRIGFELERPMQLDIYAIGELRRDAAFDHAWIIDARTRERVWQMSYDFSDPAGGAEKNRMEHRTLRLPAGRYAAIYVSDDSHDAREWNGVPPYDPAFYGLTIRVVDAADRDRVHTFPFELAPASEPVVALTKVADDEMKTAGFSLARAADVRVYAIGEGSGDRMVDFGWIVDAHTRRPAWSMRYHDTEHAGGAAKNRQVDRVVHLPAGDYQVYYSSDGSHSYEDWNSAAPLDPEHWGISLYPARDADRGAFSPYDERRDEATIASILRVGDDEHRQVRFALRGDTEVRILALGEGSGGEMYDYAWLTDLATGRTLWTMTYDRTERAGGAEKNRQASAELRLPAGDYVLHYRSDDSHSFGDWNAEPPSDPVHWGVTIQELGVAARGRR